MKNLLKLPVLILAVMLVASCGDSKKEKEEKKMTPAEMAAADAKKGIELGCEVQAAEMMGDFEKEKQLSEELSEMEDEFEKKWADADEEIMDAVNKAIDKAMEECDEKMEELSEEQRSIGTKDGEKAGKLVCEMMAFMDDPDARAKFEEEHKEDIEEFENKYDESEGSASDIAKSAYREAVIATYEDCM